MTQNQIRRTNSVVRRIRLGVRLLFAFLLLPLPALAQGPRPVGLEQLKTAEPALLSRESRVSFQKRPRGTEGFVIGFAAGFFGTILVTKLNDRSSGRSCSGCRSEDNGIIGLFAFTAGLLGGFIGYLVGRRY